MLCNVWSIINVDWLVVIEYSSHTLNVRAKKIQDLERIYKKSTAIISPYYAEANIKRRKQ